MSDRASCTICFSTPHTEGCPGAYAPPVADWHADPPEPMPCPGCGNDMRSKACEPGCMELARVNRISLDAEGQRAEAALEQVNRRAVEAWLRSGK